MVGWCNNIKFKGLWKGAELWKFYEYNPWFTTISSCLKTLGKSKLVGSSLKYWGLKTFLHICNMSTSDKVFIFDNILECIVILSVEGIFQVYKNPSKLTDCSMRLFIILMYFLVHGLNPLYNQSVVFWYGLGQVIRWTYCSRWQLLAPTRCWYQPIFHGSKYYNACHWSLK